MGKGQTKEQKNKEVKGECTTENKQLPVGGSTRGPEVISSGTTKCNLYHKLCILIEESSGFWKLISLPKGRFKE